MDPHAFTLQRSQLSRPRTQNDERFYISCSHPRHTPSWAFSELPPETDVETPGTPGVPATSDDDVLEVGEGSQ